MIPSLHPRSVNQSADIDRRLRDLERRTGRLPARLASGGGSLPPAEYSGTIIVSNDPGSDEEPTWSRDVELGDTSEPGSLKIWYASGSYVMIDPVGPVTVMSAGGSFVVLGSDFVQVYVDSATSVLIDSDGTIALERAGVTYEVANVNTITTTTDAPNAAGVKGQLHMIY